MDFDALFNGPMVKQTELDVETERGLIARALTGDNEATEVLLWQYLPVLRKTVNRSADKHNREDIQQAALIGFTTALGEFSTDKGHRKLGKVLPNCLKREIALIAKETPFTIPSRMMQRFLQIYREAGQDVIKGTTIATEFGMSKETFLTIHHALRETDSLDGTEDFDHFRNTVMGKLNSGNLRITEETYQDLTVEAAEMVAMVFSKRGDNNDFDQREEDVIKESYGWNETREGKVDREVAHALNITRGTANRVKQSALEKARKRLAVELN